jgi:hypothetical protein
MRQSIPASIASKACFQISSHQIFHLLQRKYPYANNITSLFLQIHPSSRQCSARCFSALAPSSFSALSLDPLQIPWRRNQPWQANSARLLRRDKWPENSESFVFESTTSLLNEPQPIQNSKHLSDNLDNAFSFIKPSTSVFDQHSSRELNLFPEHWMKLLYPIRPWSRKLPKLNGWNLEQHNCVVLKNPKYFSDVVLRSITYEGSWPLEISERIKTHKGESRSL